MANEDSGLLWHPTRAKIFESLKSEPASPVQLTEEAGITLAEAAYHCRALHAARCIERVEPSGPDAGGTVYEVP